jgi:hypothetical protein
MLRINKKGRAIAVEPDEVAGFKRIEERKQLMRNLAVHDVGNVNQVVGYMENNVATKHVTTKQIIEELRSIKDAFEWRLTPQQRIQGVLKGNSDGRIFDPITAVAYFRTGQFFPEGHSSVAARGVGLSFGDSVEIVAACSYGFASGAGPGDLRRDLINAVFAGAPAVAERTFIAH